MTNCRNASLPELAQILDWAAEEGWNPGLDDAEAFYAADPHGFFVATDADDTPIAAISLTNHNDSFAFLGLYIVKPESRGQGIGLALWRHALLHAGQRTVGLDGVEEQQENYKASGFAYAGGTTRFTGSVHGVEHPDISAVNMTDIPDLIARETSASGASKPAYLHAWFRDTAHRKTLVSRGPGGSNGFCTVRKCRSGAKIGPLLAENPKVARALISHAATIFKGPVTLDVPDVAGDLFKLCDDLGMEAGFKTARMYRGPFVPHSPKCFAVTSLELG